MKEPVTSFDFDAAFKALSDIEIPVANKGIAPNRASFKENFQRNISKTDALIEEYYSVDDNAELSAAQEAREAEIAQAKLARIEQIVDLNAETAEDLLTSYVGKYIIQCPQCMTMFYKDKEDVSFEEGTPDTVNVGEECQHCGNMDGYTIIGKVDSLPEEEAAEDLEDTAEDAVVDGEEATDEEELDLTITDDDGDEGVDAGADDDEELDLVIEDDELEVTEEALDIEGGRQHLTEQVEYADIEREAVTNLRNSVLSLTHDAKDDGGCIRIDYNDDNLASEIIAILKDHDYPYIWVGSENGLKYINFSRIQAPKGARLVESADSDFGDVSDAEFEELLQGELGAHKVTEVAVNTMIANENDSDDSEETQDKADNRTDSIKEAFATVEEIHEQSLQKTITESLTKVYRNVKSFELTECSLADELLIEGVIIFKSGAKRNVAYKFTEAVVDNHSVKLDGLCEGLNGKFTLSACLEDGKATLVTESLKYSYNIKGSLVEGLC